VDLARKLPRRSGRQRAYLGLQGQARRRQRLLQARGVRWAVIAVSGLVGFLAGISHWLISKA
jgi:hypothetical protein